MLSQIVPVYFITMIFPFLLNYFCYIIQGFFNLEKYNPIRIMTVGYSYNNTLLNLIIEYIIICGITFAVYMYIGGCIMKFYKNFKLNRKVKLIAIGICIAIMIFVWAVNYIKINAAFPEAQEVIYTCEEALEVEGLRIELEESELMDNTQQTITKFTDENIITKLKKKVKKIINIYM